MSDLFNPKLKIKFLKTETINSLAPIPGTLIVNMESGKVYIDILAIDNTARRISLSDGVIWRGTKSSASQLPQNPEIGDMWNVTDTGANYVWNGTEWDKLSEDLSGFAIDSAVVHLAGAETITGNKTFSGTLNAVTQSAGDNSTKVATTKFVKDQNYITSSSIPTNVSSFNNDAGYITSSDIPAIPDSTSDLTNDSGFITSSDLPTNVSDLNNDAGFITSSDIPAIPDSTSDLTNDSGFITLSDIPDISGKADDSNVVHKTGDESITGVKTFNSTITTSAVNVNGQAEFNSTVSLGSNATATTQTDTDNSTKVATTAFVKSVVSSASGTIPTKMSDLTNDAGFITSSDLPTNVSDLNNDSGFITSSDLPTNTSDLTNDSGFITSSDLPTNVSDLNNDAGYVDSTTLDTQLTSLIDTLNNAS